MEKKELEAKLDYAKRELEIEREERLNEREARREAEAKLELARNDVEAYKACCLEAEAKLEEAAIELDQVGASRSVACKRIEGLQKSLARAERVIELQEAEAELATFRQVELEGKIHFLEVNHTIHCETLWNEHCTELQAEQAEQAELEAKLDWKERCLTSQGLEHAKQVSGLQARLEQAEARERGLRLDLQGMVQAQEELKHKHKQELATQASFKKLAQELAYDQEELEQAQAIAFLRQELGKERNLSKLLRRQVEALKSKLEDAQEDYKILEARKQAELEQAELDSRRASNWMNDKLLEAQAEASFTQEALEEKVEELARLKARLDRAQEKLASQASELDVNGLE